MSKTITIITAVVGVVVMSVGLVYLQKAPWRTAQAPQNETAETDANGLTAADLDPNRETPDTVRADKALVAQMDAGDYEDALGTFELLYGETDINYTDDPDELARAWTTKDFLRYKSDYNIDTIVQAIDTQKAIVADTSVSDRLRARALNMVGLAFCIYGRNPALLPYIYSGDYEKYMAEKDPGYASFKILEESYDLYKTPRAAIGMSHWHVKKLLAGGLTEEEKAEHIAEAERLLKEADAEAQKEMDRTAELAETDQYINSRRYPSYLFWRAFVVGGLAAVGVGDYKDQYKQEYQNFFELVNSMGDYNIAQYLPPAYWHYAWYLRKIDGNDDEAHAAIQKSVELAENDPRPLINEFTIFMGHERQKQPTDIMWTMMTEMAEFDPVYRDYIDNAVKLVTSS